MTRSTMGTHLDRLLCEHFGPPTEESRALATYLSGPCLTPGEALDRVQLFAEHAWMVLGCRAGMEAARTGCVRRLRGLGFEQGEVASLVNAVWSDLRETITARSAVGSAEGSAAA